MAEPKKIKTRIINKHAQAAVWLGTQDKFTPLEGEFIVYDKDETFPIPRIKVGNGSNNVNTLDFISKGMVDNTSLTCNNEGTISLNQEYIDYLDAQVYAYPAISAFNIVGSNVEVGTTVSVTSFDHTETNSKNIDGKLTLTSNKNTSINLAVNPSDTKATVSFSDSYQFTTNTTLTYTLTGKDTRGNTITKQDSISSYFPSFIGASKAESITNTTGLDKIASASLKGSRSVPATSHYVYFISTTAINTIKSGGFDVSYSKLNNITLSINGISKSYNVYRTNELIVSTLTYDIT